MKTHLVNKEYITARMAENLVCRVYGPKYGPKKLDEMKKRIEKNPHRKQTFARVSRNLRLFYTASGKYYVRHSIPECWKYLKEEYLWK